MSAITAVVFDLGGVLSVSPFAALDVYGDELGLPAGTLGSYLRGDPVFSRLEVGEISAREFWKSMCERVQAAHPVRLDIHRLVDAAEAGGELNPEMLDLVRSLRGRYSLGLLTNNVREAAGWRGALPADLFDVFIDSSQVGLRKPDPRIFTLLLERLGRPAAQVVFVDDFEENLPPAAAMGIHTVHFQGAAACRAALAALGVT